MLTQTIAEHFQQVCDDSVLFAEQMLMVQDKSRQLVPLKYNRAQQHYLKNRTNRDLIVKARQLGFSTFIQGEMARFSWTRPVAVLTMADKQENTDKLRRMMQRFYDHIPPHLPKPQRSEANAAITVYPGIGSEVQIATAGAQTSGRAGTVTHFHGSEVAYWKNADWMIAGALQAVPEHLEDTWVVFESTANGAQGWFYQECMAALAGDSEWTVHFYAWWWDEKYRIPLEPGEILTYSEEEQVLIAQHGLSPEQIKWRRKKQRDLKGIFQQEYPETPESAFLTSGGGVFTLEPHMIATGITEIEPVENGIYVSGQDFGQDDDYTALSIFRVMPDGSNHEVYINRWRKQSWASMRANVIEQLKRYHVEKHIAERNSMGSSQIEDLVHDIESAGLQTSVQGFTTTNRSKDNAVKMLQKALSEQGLQLLDVDYANHEMRTFETRQTTTGLWTYTHPDGGHDDCVDVRLLANYAATQLWI